jgi:hypothetical protein
VERHGKEDRSLWVTLSKALFHGSPKAFVLLPVFYEEF